MNPLTQKIIQHIRTHGPMPFERFMEMALYAPGLGYYMSPAMDIGKAADYYTSTNVNALFGAMVAGQVAQMWEIMGRPDSFVFTEQGGGRGLFALDFLDELGVRYPDCYRRLTYRLVDISPSLRERQRTLLQPHNGKVEWYEALQSVPRFTGVFFSNELVDAFPVHMVQFTRDGLREVYVAERGGTLREETGPCSSDELSAYLASLGVAMPAGYRTEINLNAKRWIRNVADRLHRGYVLTVDYGFNTWDYYSGERSTGTLICYYRHATNDRPLERPGEQDITAHVDFSALLNWGREANLEPLGFVTQSTFLLNMDIDRRLTELHQSIPEDEYLAMVAQVRTLLMPDAMGETHKVLVQGKNVPGGSLRGLHIRNRLDYLLSPKP